MRYRDGEPLASRFRPLDMTRLIRPALLWTLLLCACSPAITSPRAVPPTLASDPGFLTVTATVDILPTNTTEVLPPPKLIATLATPHIEQGPDGAITVPPPGSQGCAYQWANQALPELSGQFLAMLQQVQPAAQGSAYAFGENCIRADGSVTFLPMETDFDITLPTESLSDEAELGDWIVKVMQVIENLPPDQLVGPRPGRVSLVFQSNGQEKIVNFYIDQYRALAPGLSKAEIFRALQSP